MASSNPKRMSDKTEEEMQLEAEVQAATDKMKTMFEKTRDTDEDIRKTREEQRQKQERLRQIRAERVESDLRERHAARLEAQKKTGNQEAGLQADFKALQIEYDRIREQLETLSNERMAAIEQLNVLKRKDSEQNEMLKKLKESLQRTTSFSRTQQKEKREKEDEIEKLTSRIKYLESETSNAKVQPRDQSEFDSDALTSENDRINEQLEALSNEDMNATDELNVLRRQNSELNESLEELKENLQRITSFSRTLQKEKRKEEDDNVKLMRHIKCLEEKILAAQQIAAETQLRQLNELETLSEETRQLKQTMTTLHRQQQQQQQQSTTEEHLQGKVVLLEPSTSVCDQANS